MESVCMELIAALHKAGRSLEESTKNLRVAFIGSRVSGGPPSDLLAGILRSASVYKDGMLPLESNLVERVRRFCDNYTALNYSDFKAMSKEIVEEAKDNQNCANIAKNLHKDMLIELNHFKTQLGADYSAQPPRNFIEGSRVPRWLLFLKPHPKDNTLVALISTGVSFTTGIVRSIFSSRGAISPPSAVPMNATTLNETMSYNHTRKLLQNSGTGWNVESVALVLVVFGISWATSSFIFNKMRARRRSSGRNEGDFERSQDMNDEMQTLEALLEGLEGFAVAMISVSKFFTEIEEDLMRSSTADSLLQQHFETTKKIAPEMQRAAQVFHHHSVSAETDVMSSTDTTVQDDRVAQFLRLKR
ncbi:hypothetical protein BSKO_13225 [Bryopsis sp. KO-2023]|nr:hypothetical protein BSKO_13225 [Bryopsis sp. KO-2023]